MMQRRTPLLMWAACTMTLLAPAAPAFAQQQMPRQQQPAPPQAIRTEDQALRIMLGQLAEEAEAARSAAAFTHASPDIKSRFLADHPEVDVLITEAAILRALATPQSRDAFADAYIRWQLTSFEPSFAAFDDRAFFRFMQAAPAMVHNPQADPRFLADLERIERMGPLSPENVAQLREHLESRSKDAAIAEAMNRPATEYRDWVAARLGEDGLHPRLWLIERLTAMIHAGWPVRNIKSEITRNFTSSIDDASFTEDDRRNLLMHISSLRGFKREWLHEATFFADGSCDFSIYSSSITQANVDEWRKRLYGIGRSL
ncbi:MAG: hypothetical protein ACR2GY_02865 [Phycisphaerales bacterium]